MTIICVKDNIMAADSGIRAGYCVFPSAIPKIYRLVDGGLLGCAGNIHDSARLRYWAGMKFSKASKPILEDVQFLWLKPDGTLTEGDKNGPGALRLQPLAIGFPSEYAQGTLDAGASAEQAVLLTIQKTTAAWGEVQVETLETAETL